MPQTPVAHQGMDMQPLGVSSGVWNVDTGKGSFKSFVVWDRVKLIGWGSGVFSVDQCLSRWYMSKQYPG